MAELKASGLSKQKQDAAADRLQQGGTIIGEEVKKKDADDMTSASSSVSSSTPPSPNASETDLKDIIKTTQQQHSAVGAKRRVKSLSERSKVPMSFYASITRQYPAVPSTQWSSTEQYGAVPGSIQQYLAVPSSSQQYPAVPSNTWQYMKQVYTKASKWCCHN